MTISRWILLRMRNILDKSCRENHNTFYFQKLCFQIRAVYETMSKNLVVPEATNEVTIWGIQVSCWISKTIRTHAREWTRPRSQAPLHARTQALAHTHIQIQYLLFSTTKIFRKSTSILRYTRWFKYDQDDFCVNKSQFVPVIFEPPCTYLQYLSCYVLCQSLLVLRRSTLTLFIPFNFRRPSKTMSCCLRWLCDKPRGHHAKL